MILVALLAQAAAVGAYDMEAELGRYSDCIVRNAVRLEPSGESADSIVRAATKICQELRVKTIANFVNNEGKPSGMTAIESGQLFIEILNPQEEEFQKAALVAVMEQRLKNNAPNQ